ncbi:acetyl-CoA hydrolase/transferase family protein [Desulfotignum balticum]|uniref:acetyl-CoA hydrolase/transferase family protein n=1 Tax=Desulfotignum balticum TaxID=115781 RepID=UPI00146D2632|nr:acetyl-CoA hydrolase/transferase family protein [Desulfotignum balticum]
MRWQDRYKKKLLTAEQAAGLVTSGSEVLFSMMNQPMDIGHALASRYNELENVTITSHWVEDYPFLHPEKHPEMTKVFSIQDAFPLRHTRKEVQEHQVDYKPTVFGLSDGKRQKDNNRGSLYHFKDFFFLKVAPPNSSGYCSFGHQTWYSPSACKTAKKVIAEIDPDIPWVFGEYIHMDDIDYLVEAPMEEPAAKVDHAPATSTEDWELSQVIGVHTASLIRDGDTLQIGTGTASEAVINFLDDKNDLGIDTELIFRQLIDMKQRGIITDKRKNIDRGKSVASSFRTYTGADPDIPKALKYISQNPGFEFRDISYICNVPRIARQDNMVAINNALAVDLMGQIVVTHVGPNPIGSPGGSIEYCLGAHYAKNGRSIFALPSTALGGKVSRIMPRLDPGAVVAIPMFYADYIITEHGVANLDCKNLRERAEALISIAHPDFQPELKAEAKKLFGL